MINQPAPDFHAMTDSGPVALSDFQGKKLVLYFYPKDDTPGCTLEARGFRDHHEAFAARNAVVVGVSKDTAKKHASWRTKECLPFALIADDGTLCALYGAWRQKKLYGREYMGIARITVLIDEAGIIRQIWDPVKASGHAEQVLAAL